MIRGSDMALKTKPRRGRMLKGMMRDKAEGIRDERGEDKGTRDKGQEVRETRMLKGVIRQWS